VAGMVMTINDHGQTPMLARLISANRSQQRSFCVRSDNPAGREP
jgi:hypothetical protein